MPQQKGRPLGGSLDFLPKGEFSAAFIAYRKKHGLTQHQLAEKLGLSVRSVSRIETQQGRPNASTLDLLGIRYSISSTVVDLPPEPARSIGQKTGLSEPLSKWLGSDEGQALSVQVNKARISATATTVAERLGMRPQTFLAGLARVATLLADSDLTLIDIASLLED